MPKALASHDTDATEALRERIRLAESEITQMKHATAEKERAVQSWRQLVAILKPHDATTASK